MNQTKNLTLCAFVTVIYIIGSKIVIPTGIIPITLQTLVVITTAIVLQPKQILVSYSLYMFMGLIGFPVFANGGGIAYILQPSFGFLLAFPIAACFISFIKRKFHLHSFISLLPCCIASLVIIYLIGCLYMYAIFHLYLGIDKSLMAVISIGAVPFLFTDFCSICIGCFCALRIQKVLILSSAYS